MNPSREEALFALALEEPATERNAFPKAVCGDDEVLRYRLESLLAAHEQPETLLAMQADAVRLREDASARHARPTIQLDLADAPDKAVGQKLGRYKLLERVGELDDAASFHLFDVVRRGMFRGTNDDRRDALMKSLSFFCLLSCLAGTGALSVAAADWPQWRGPQRNGLSPESGLLQAWPAEGPRLDWQVTGIGSGYAAPAVAGDRVYLLANETLDNEFVQALSVTNGQRLWSTPLGKVGHPNQNPKFPAARSTPTIDGLFLFALGSDGDLACVEIGSGKVRWKRNLRADFGGQPGTWAYAESPLIDGDTLICTPGGSQATLLGLDKRTGAVRWQCSLPEADEAGYASAIVVDFGGTRQVVQLLQKGLVGVDVQTGRFLWRYGKAVSRYGANIPSPVAHQGFIYCAAAGTGGGTVKLRATAGGVEAEELYFGPKMPTAIGGAVIVGDHLYGTTAQTLLCVELATGEIRWEDRALGAAALCVADGRLYLRAENGEVGLAEPSPEGYLERGRFTPPAQPERISPMEKAWAYPAIAEGRLYLRDHGTLWCYDLRAAR